MKRPARIGPEKYRLILVCVCATVLGVVALSGLFVPAPLLPLMYWMAGETEHPARLALPWRIPATHGNARAGAADRWATTGRGLSLASGARTAIVVIVSMHDVDATARAISAWPQACDPARGLCGAAELLFYLHDEQPGVCAALVHAARAFPYVAGCIHGQGAAFDGGAHPLSSPMRSGAFYRMLTPGVTGDATHVALLSTGSGPRRMYWADQIISRAAAVLYSTSNRWAVLRDDWALFHIENPALVAFLARLADATFPLAPEHALREVLSARDPADAGLAHHFVHEKSE